MVIQRPAFDEGLQLAREFDDLQARDVTKLHQGMGADVSAATGAAGQFRVGPPGRLHLAGGFELGGQPPLEIVGVHPTNLPQQTRLNDVARTNSLFWGAVSRSATRQDTAQRHRPLRTGPFEKVCQLQGSAGIGVEHVRPES